MIHTDGKRTIANAEPRRVKTEPQGVLYPEGMYRELDSRSASGVTIEWHLAESGSHLVVVIDHTGTPVAVLKDLSGEQAREAFDHPFALHVVPDLFKRES